MDGHRIGRLHRLLRHRSGLTQEDLADRAGVARWKIVKLEAGAIAGLRFGDVELLFAALDGRLDVRAWYHGAAGDRLLDELHAGLLGGTAAYLNSQHWLTKVEVTFSRYGERGSIDLLAWHAGTQALILVLPEHRTARRQVERHERVLRAALPAGSRELRRWMRHPVGAIAGIWFLTDAQHLNAKRNPSAIRRVRRHGSRSVHAGRARAGPPKRSSDPLIVGISDR